MPPVQTNVIEIGRRMKARLLDLNVLADPSQILWSARRGDLPHIKGIQDLVIRPRRNQDIKSFSAGGGRYGMICIRTIDLILRTSNASGVMSSDEVWLEQHTLFEDAVLDALAECMLVDPDDSTIEYLTCPLKYLGTTEEQRETDPPTKNLWGNSVLSLECHYKPKVDVTRV